MTYFPLVLHYADRPSPEAVNSAQEIRNSVEFKLVSIFPTLPGRIEIDRTKLGWRVSDYETYTIHSNRATAIRQHFDRLAGQ